MPQRPESVKRRTLWINDEDWKAIVERANAAGQNASVYMRERALIDRPTPKPSSKR